MSERFTCTALVSGFIAMSARHGISLDEVYADLGHCAQDSDAPFVDVSVEDLDAFLNELGARAQNPDFFLDLGERISFESLGVVGQAIATAPTARESIVQFNECRNIVHPLARFKIQDLPLGRTFIEYDADVAYAFSGDAKYQETLMKAVAKMMHTLHGANAGVYSVSFTYPQPEYVAVYEKVFEGIEVLFNQPSCGLTVSTAMLDYTTKGSSPQFNQTFIERARMLLSKLPSQQSLSRQVVSIIEQKIGYEVFNIDDVAKQLSLTPRTLQRRLKEEGTTYAQLRDSVRFHYAEESLRASNVDMASIAASLGFSEPANFYAAFKRWQGVSPGEYRKRFLVS